MRVVSLGGPDCFDLGSDRGLLEGGCVYVCRERGRVGKGGKLALV